MASLYFKYAAMNSGKSTQLLQAHYNYAERGMNPAAFTAGLDTRSGEGRIAARIGLSLPAAPFADGTDIFASVRALHGEKRVDVVMIDEAQFLSEEQVLQCARIVDELEIPVLCYGLRTDFTGAFFPGSAALMRLADNLEEIRAVCWCGRKAIMTARVGADGRVARDGAQVLIGGNDLYTSLCRKHFMAGKAAAEPAREEAV